MIDMTGSGGREDTIVLDVISISIVSPVAGQSVETVAGLPSISGRNSASKTHHVYSSLFPALNLWFAGVRLSPPKAVIAPVTSNSMVERGMSFS
jgi:hypothetical protein